MALFTTRTKLAVMHVFIAMASDATAAHHGGVFPLGRRCLVAALAGDFAMGTVQFVGGFGVMIKVPD